MTVPQDNATRTTIARAEMDMIAPHPSHGRIGTRTANPREQQVSETLQATRPAEAATRTRVGSPSMTPTMADSTQYRPRPIWRQVRHPARHPAPVVVAATLRESVLLINRLLCGATTGFLAWSQSAPPRQSVIRLRDRRTPGRGEASTTTAT